MMKRNMIKGSLVTLSVVGMGVGSTVMATAHTGPHTTKPTMHHCMKANLSAKHDGWQALLNGEYIGKRLTVKQKERMLADDMENAAQNMRNGSYRACWAE
jgi:hypothetical protein